MGRLRGAIFGCGMIAEYHLKAWAQVPEVEIVALGDRDVDRAELRRAEFVPAARVYAGLPELLGHETLDFIDILTPPAAHHEHCLLAKAAGLNITCQKPLCDTLADARALAAAFDGYPRLFAVHENHRYRPWFQDVVRRARDGQFGTIRFLRLEHHDAEPAEAYKLQSEAGVWVEYGTHLVDMMRDLLGEPQRVTASFRPISPNVRGPSLAHVVYEYPETTAVIDTAWKPAGLLHGSVLVKGDRGEAFYEGTLTRGERSRYRVVRGRAVELDEERSPQRDYEDSFVAVQRECAAAMLGGPPVVQTAAEHLRTLECTFAAVEAARRGGVVEMVEFAGGR
jgi:predicted dehydrogenase